MNIALTGKFRAGKDAVAKYLVEKYGYTRFAFGDELKKDFHRRYPEIPKDPKPRVGCQMHGQMMRRLLGENIWVDKCFLSISLTNNERMSNFGGASNALPVVISDLRQPNEYERCREEGFFIVRVSCPDELRIERALAAGDEFKEEDLQHETELHIDTFDVDFEIDNSGTLDELHTQIDRMMKALVSGEFGAFGNDCPNGACEV